MCFHSSTNGFIIEYNFETDSNKEQSTSNKEAISKDDEIVNETSDSNQSSLNEPMSIPSTSSGLSEISNAVENINLSEAEFENECKNHVEFFRSGKDNRRFVFCKTCEQFPNTVKTFSDNKKMPPITSKEGTRYRKPELEKHFSSKYHIECKKAKLLADNPNDEQGEMDVHISHANKALANHIGGLVLQIYNDAKRLTLSAYSWPSRYVTSQVANSFNFDSKEPVIPLNMNLQYVNLPSHLDLMSYIVKSDKNNFKDKIQSARACSIRVDGSIDRTQIDKIYVLLKLITKEGNNEWILLGVAEQTERKAEGLFKAVKEAILKNLDYAEYSILMKKISSICTDGANVNIGDSGGLWKFFEDEIRAEQSDVPLVKIWCSAHRLDLVWDDICTSQKKIDKILNTVSSIASYFRSSSLSLNEMKDIATKNGFPLLSLPKLFDIRWTQYTFTAVTNTLHSWRALVAYFQASQQSCAQAAGYLAFISNEQNLKMMAFLADILQIYQRYHKKIQSDELTILKLITDINMLNKSLSDLKQKRLEGDWEDAVEDGIKIREEDGKSILNEVELTQKRTTRSNQNFDMKQMRDSIIDSILQNISKRFASDKDLTDIIRPFVGFQTDTNLKRVHEMFGRDLDLSSLSLQFNELVKLKSELEIGVSLLTNIKKLIDNAEYSSNYKDVITILCRVQVCTPHSADVERCVSSNNLLKTPMRNRMCIDSAKLESTLCDRFVYKR